MRRGRRPSPQTVDVLVALAQEPTAWRHGYDLCRDLGLQAGTVYPILLRLAERGQVESTWETEATPGRPRRHLYRLSRGGAELVAELQRAETVEVRRAGPAWPTASAGAAG